MQPLQFYCCSIALHTTPSVQPHRSGLVNPRLYISMQPSRNPDVALDPGSCFISVKSLHLTPDRTSSFHSTLTASITSHFEPLGPYLFLSPAGLVAFCKPQTPRRFVMLNCVYVGVACNCLDEALSPLVRVCQSRTYPSRKQTAPDLCILSSMDETSGRVCQVGNLDIIKVSNQEKYVLEETARLNSTTLANI